MNLTFYCCPCSYSSQIESKAILNLRLGYTSMGVSFRRIKRCLWKAFPVFSVVLLNHSSQNDMRWLFRLWFFGMHFGYLVKGRLTNTSLHSAKSLGFHFMRRVI